MAQLINIIDTDEVTYAQEFYKSIYGEDWSKTIKMDRYTDGFQDGILFEHKLNIKSYGEARALGQALIYLTRFNRDGMPVPRYVWLVSQEEEKIYIHDMLNYKDYINDIEAYANLKPSSEDNTFLNGKISKCKEIIDYKLTPSGLKKVWEKLEASPEYLPVTITEHNVYGWSQYFYANAAKHKQKPKKVVLFDELRNPTKTLKGYIEKWEGEVTEFKYIMDILNDPETQQDLGAFYTHPLYAQKAAELVIEAIKRVPEGNDYIILDRCAGTGNLEMYFDEDVLSHVILSTYELKEWMVLKDRYGKDMVRYIIPPIPQNPEELPEHTEGLLRGANALTRDIIDNPVVRKYLDDPKCTIILFENPPFVENTTTTKNDKGQTVVQKKKSTWKDTYISKEMAKDISGVALNDMGNAFIWSGFKYFLRQPTDSYIVFSPIKYWKAHHLINKEFVDGYAFNRKHFHSDATCVSCIFWTNENANINEFNLKAYDIQNNTIKEDGIINVKRVFSVYSDAYFDTQKFENDIKGGIVCDIDGTTTKRKTSGLNPISNDNILGYLVAFKNTFDNPRYCSMLLRGGVYNGHGFYLRSNNFIEKLPLFAASRYTDYQNSYKIMGMTMKSADKASQYKKDVENGKLDDFLCKCLIWTGFTHYAHMRSLLSEDGKLYKNDLCFDSLNGETTLAYQKLNEFIANGYVLSDEEKAMFDKMNSILQYIKDNCSEEYNPTFTYGLYQIDETINVKTPKIDSKGRTYNVPKYGDLNNLIKDLKKMIKQYYIDNIVGVLFEYEFLK